LQLQGIRLPYGVELVLLLYPHRLLLHLLFRYTPLWTDWGMMEWSCGDQAAARQVFASGSQQESPPLFLLQLLDTWRSREEAEGEAGVLNQVQQRIKKLQAEVATTSVTQPQEP
jgi:hypothetical protein